MKELIGEDLFDQIETADAICITTNCSVIEEKDTPINPMGGGCAGAAARKWSNIPYTYGSILLLAPHVPVVIGYANRQDSDDILDPDQFGTEMIVDWCAVVAYPTMHSITQPASLELVVRSAKLLTEMADQRGWKTIVIPRPGAGIGGLDWETQVKPALEPVLDDRFVLIHKEFAVGPFTRKWKSTAN